MNCTPQYSSNWKETAKFRKLDHMLPFEFKKKESHTSILTSTSGQKFSEMAGLGGWKQQKGKDRVRCFTTWNRKKFRGKIARSGGRQSQLWLPILALSDSVTAVSLSVKWRRWYDLPHEGVEDIKSGTHITWSGGGTVPGICSLSAGGHHYSS